MNEIYAIKCFKDIKTFYGLELTDNQKQVYDILLTPINAVKGKGSSISRNGNFINTTQLYRYKSKRKALLDPDMSEFAIGFYKIIYKQLNGILTSEGLIENESFAGDTMNSFNSIANITEGAGKSTKKRTPESCWPRYLIEYCKMYHCLANFWVIPMYLGRGRSKKLNKYDCMDRFMLRLKSENNSDNEILKQYSDYCEVFKDFRTFIDLHFVDAYTDIKVIDYKSENSELIIARFMHRICQRAKALAQSEHGNDLYNYFEKYQLLERK